MSKYESLFNAGELGDIKVKNRVFMAPLTRNRAMTNGVPEDMAVKYYSQRSTAGLIISEATQISPLGKGYAGTPGIYDNAQTAQWKKISESVHQNDGKFVVQLWHVGRISHTSLLPDGHSPQAPSAIKANAQTFTGTKQEEVSDPKEMSVTEIRNTIKDYVHSANLAMLAGADGVEIHGANGYLLNQFIATNSNQRADEYGGSVKNRAKFLVEVVKAVSDEIGSKKVGVRLSPTGTFNDIDDQEIKENYKYILEKFNEMNLAYLHFVEKFPGTDVSAEDKKILVELKKMYKGNYIANGGFTAEEAEKEISDGSFAVAFGRPFISNPDLPGCFKHGIDLTEPDHSTFYGGDEKGYTTYPIKTKM